MTSLRRGSRIGHKAIPQPQQNLPQPQSQMLSVTVQHQNNRLDLEAMSQSLDVNGSLPVGSLLVVHHHFALHLFLGAVLHYDLDWVFGRIPVRRHFQALRVRQGDLCVIKVLLYNIVLHTHCKFTCNRLKNIII